MSVRIDVPAAVLNSFDALTPSIGPSGDEWARTVPRLLADGAERWGLAPDGPVRSGRTAVALPVRRDDEPLVLRVGWPHAEAVGDHLALRRWAGHGAVRLVAADPATWTMLLERLDPSTDLNTVAIDEACELAGEVMSRLHVPAPPTIGAAVDFCDDRLSNLESVPDVLPRRLVVRARGLLRELSVSDAGRSLLHGGLHFRNILRSQRAGADAEAWLAIDPRPLAGHPGFELQPLLRDRVEEYGTGSAFRWGVRRRLEIACEAAGVDEEVARLWSIVHSVIVAFRVAQDGDGEATSFHIALLKALED